MTRFYRLIVTGSRNFRGLRAVDNRLEQHLNSLGPGVTLLVVHGDCRQGPDSRAKGWALMQKARGRPVDHEAHPAKWNVGGGITDTSAGLIRNTAMVACGADRGLAFIAPCESHRCCRTDFHGSHGTMHCVRAMMRARVPLERVFSRDWPTV